MFFTSFSISHRFILACHFLAFVFYLNCCNLPYCHIFSNLVFFTDIFIFHYVTYVCLLRLMPLCKTCFDSIFIPLHLTKWAVAHESLCSIIKIVNFSTQSSIFLILFEKLTRLSQFYFFQFFDDILTLYLLFILGQF